MKKRGKEEKSKKRGGGVGRRNHIDEKKNKGKKIKNKKLKLRNATTIFSQ